MRYLRFFLFFLIASCTGNTIYEKPKGLIPKDTMVALLTDMHIAVSAKQIKNKFYKKGITYMPYVFEKYNIDSTRFKSSNKYYASIIDEYDKMLLEVKNNLENKGKVLQEELAKKDSIKKSEIEKTKSVIPDKDSVQKIKEKLIKSVREE